MNNGTYMSVLFSDKSNELLENIRSSFGLPKDSKPDKDEFHVTIAYSRKKFNIEPFKAIEASPLCPRTLTCEYVPEIWDTDSDSG